MRILHAIGLVLGLGLGVAACDDGSGRVRKRDCDAVIAHLTVLEKDDDGDRPMCKYHRDCDGERAERYASTCQKVLVKKQADCYLRATSLDDADACLPRDLFDDALRTGRKAKDVPEGGVGDDDDPWFGGGTGDPATQAMRELKLLKRDACSCKDSRCADQVQRRLEDFTERFANDNTLENDMDAAMKLFTDFYECVQKARSTADAGVPHAYPYYRDP